MTAMSHVELAVFTELLLLAEVGDEPVRLDQLVQALGHEHRPAAVEAALNRLSDRGWVALGAADGLVTVRVVE